MRLEMTDPLILKKILISKLKEKGAQHLEYLAFNNRQINKYFAFPVDPNKDLEKYVDCAVAHFEHILRDYNLTCKKVYFNIVDFGIVSQIDDIEDLCRGLIVFRERET